MQWQTNKVPFIAKASTKDAFRTHINTRMNVSTLSFLAWDINDIT